MKILYLDSAGDTGFPRKGSSKFYVLAGISADPLTWHPTSDKIKQIKDRHFGQIKQVPRELHYHDIINNRFPYNMMASKKQLADEVFDVIRSGDFVLFAMVLDKERHWNKYANPEPPALHMFEAMINRFERYLRRVNDVGAIVMDKSGAQDKALVTTFEIYKVTGTYYQPITKIIDTVFFTPSETSVFLQMCDFVAYAVWSKYERNKADRFGEIESKFDSYGIRTFP